MNYCRCTLGYAGPACEKSILPSWYIDFLVGILVLSNLAFLFVLKSSLRDFIKATAQARQAQQRKQLLLMETKREERYENLEEAERNRRGEEAYHRQGEEDESEEGEQENGGNEKEEKESSLMLGDVDKEIKFSRDTRWRAVLRIGIFGMASKKEREEKEEDVMNVLKHSLSSSSRNQSCFLQIRRATKKVT